MTTMPVPTMKERVMWKSKRMIPAQKERTMAREVAKPFMMLSLREKGGEKRQFVGASGERGKEFRAHL